MIVLVTGSSGMLGKALSHRPSPHFVISYPHSELDIAYPTEVSRAILGMEPSVVINCAGIVKGRNESPAEYIRVNAMGPRILAARCVTVGARLIQVSTDCVFSGRIHAPLSEYDIPDALDIYGRSKLLGEVNEPHLTIRTSFIGWGKRGLLAWLASKEGEVVPGYWNVWWNGLTAPALADILLAMVDHPEISGVQHVFGERVSKGFLLSQCADVLGLDVGIDLAEAPETIDRTLCTVREHIKVPPLIDQLRMLRERYD